MELGERNSRYFLSLDKKIQEIKNITCIVSEDNALLLLQRKRCWKNNVNFMRNFMVIPVMPT